MDDVTRRQAIKLAATATGVGTVALGTNESQAADDRHDDAEAIRHALEGYVDEDPTPEERKLWERRKDVEDDIPYGLFGGPFSVMGFVHVREPNEEKTTTNGTVTGLYNGSYDLNAKDRKAKLYDENAKNRLEIVLALKGEHGAVIWRRCHRGHLGKWRCEKMYQSFVGW